MSKTTLALEEAVAAVIANSRPGADGKRTARQRHEVDKAFARTMKLIAPRVRHFIRQYGLAAHWDDAEQACAIAVHRAIEAYDPEKAQFTTFVNWQIRGELQSLRFRLMTDQRPSAKKVDATTVSLHSMAVGPEGEETTLESVIQDDHALSRTEAGASDYLASSATRSLIDAYIDHLCSTAVAQLKRRPRPKRITASVGGVPVRAPDIEPAEMEALELRLKRDREIVERRLFDLTGDDKVDEDTGVTKERVRQITKRAARTIAEIAGSDDRFNIMAQYRKTGMLRTRNRTFRAEAGGAPLNPSPSVVILPDSTRPQEEIGYVLGDRSREAIIDVSEMLGAMGDTGLRH